MTSRTNTFPSDLAASTRVGLTRGAGLPGPRLESFAEAEMRYRQQRLLEDFGHRRNATGHPARAHRTARELMTRWTTWLPSAPLHHSSAEPQSSSACGN